MLKNIAQKFAVLGTTVTGLALSAGSVFAEEQPPFTFDINKTDFDIRDFGKLVQGLLNLVLFISALLVFGYLIWGGIQWITSGGDKGKTEEARNKITAAIVGLAIIAASYAIFRLVIYVLGISDPLNGIEGSNIRLY